MSYDIIFVPRRDGQDWDAALDAAEDTDDQDAVLSPERLGQWDRVVAALQRLLGEVHDHRAPDVCEATAADGSGLQVSLFPDEAAVTFPYWEQPDRAAFHDLVVDVVGVVERETGLHAWDAQADHPFDGRVHDEVGLAATRRIAGGTTPSDGTTTDGTPSDGTTTDGTALASPPAPVGATAPAAPTSADELTRDRKRALRYLVIGAVVIVGALLLRSNGEPSTLSGLAIAVGVFDLVIGAALWRSWSRRSREAS